MERMLISALTRLASGSALPMPARSPGTIPPVITATPTDSAGGTIDVPLGRKESFTAEGSPGSERSIGRILRIAAQLALLLALLYLLEIEPGSGLPRVLPLVFAGFLIHAFLPPQYRLPFFLLMSLAVAGLVLGPPGSMLLFGIGTGILGLCHLPVSFRLRVLAIMLVGAGLALPRAFGSTPTSGASVDPPTSHSLAALVLPVLGSMFMFRVIIYLYDLKHEDNLRRSAKTRTSAKTGIAVTSPWMRLSYFFLFPNVCFLLFPVVDYATFRRTYYDTKAEEIYENGNWWIALGIAYILLYRAVYHFLTPSQDEIGGIRAVASFMTSSYLVYLRVVGQFHLIIGMLCLFGFNLPPAHRYFLLASSFTDFWRRTRIEWKDFMVKIVYYPAVVPLQRRVGKLPALVIATIGVFAATWFLHSYQWFWLTGDFPVSITDVVFWGIVGACVLANSILETRGSRKPAIKGWTLRGGVIHSLRVLGIFSFFSVLWSYWSSSSLESWLSIVERARGSGTESYAKFAAILIVLVAAGVVTLKPKNLFGYSLTRGSGGRIA